MWVAINLADPVDDILALRKSLSDADDLTKYRYFCIAVICPPNVTLLVGTILQALIYRRDLNWYCFRTSWPVLFSRVWPYEAKCFRSFESGLKECNNNNGGLGRLHDVKERIISQYCGANIMKFAGIETSSHSQLSVKRKIPLKFVSSYR